MFAGSNEADPPTTVSFERSVDGASRCSSFCSNRAPSTFDGAIFVFGDNAFKSQFAFMLQKLLAVSPQRFRERDCALLLFEKICSIAVLLAELGEILAVEIE